MGRSGTTLLRMMLNSHSKIAIASETYFFVFWSHRQKCGDLNNDDNFKKLWNDLIKCKYFNDLKLKNSQKIYEDLLKIEKGVINSYLRHFLRNIQNKIINRVGVKKHQVI